MTSCKGDGDRVSVTNISLSSSFAFFSIDVLSFVFCCRLLPFPDFPASFPACGKMVLRRSKIRLECSIFLLGVKSDATDDDTERPSSPKRFEKARNDWINLSFLAVEDEVDCASENSLIESIEDMVDSRLGPRPNGSNNSDSGEFAPSSDTSSEGSHSSSFDGVEGFRSCPSVNAGSEIDGIVVNAVALALVCCEVLSSSKTKSLSLLSCCC